MSHDPPQVVHVRYETGHIVLSGQMSKRLCITAHAMLQDLLDCVNNRSIDFICIAAGAYTLDRISKRSRTKSNEAGVRTFQICFHVADIAYWSQPETADRVSELLNFLTGDLWLVSFTHHDRPGTSNQQLPLELKGTVKPSRLALYSGGLDSAAGLACQLLSGHRDLLILTAGHQSSIRRRAIDQVKALAHILHNAGTLTHASFVLHLEGSGRLREQETTQRARGFLFCAAAAVLAAAYAIPYVDVYENGHGAINLPLSTGAMSNGFSTRGAHPTFLRMISTLASDVLATQVTFELPFMWMTKTNMVAALANTPGLANWASQSHSCVHTSWRESDISHCGKCAACIERHQAFVGAGIEDPTRYSSLRLWASPDPLGNDYFRAYLNAAHEWSNHDPRTLLRLEQHRIISGLEKFDGERLAALNRQHAAETLAVFGGFLKQNTQHTRANTDSLAPA